MRIALLDFGAGNLASAVHAFQALGEVSVCARPEAVPADARALVLPGDGSFGAAMDNLEASGLAAFLRSSPLPLLGICVGFQLLFEGSEEDGGVEGLGLLRGRVRRFPASSGKIPHMGWNRARAAKSSSLLSGLPGSEWFYFVHSYRPEAAGTDREAVLLEADYGENFPAAVESGRLCGFQFHPEKSWKSGRRILANWVSGLR